MSLTLTLLNHFFLIQSAVSFFGREILTKDYLETLLGPCVSLGFSRPEGSPTLVLVPLHIGLGDCPGPTIFHFRLSVLLYSRRPLGRWDLPPQGKDPVVRGIRQKPNTPLVTTVHGFQIFLTGGYM